MTRAAIGALILICGGLLACSQSEPAPAEREGPRIGDGFAIELTKAWWGKNRDSFIRKIRTGALASVAWASYEACKEAYPRGTWPTECGDYSDEDAASEDMVPRAIKLVIEGEWAAEWDPSTSSWYMTARNQAFTWRFRLFDDTLTVAALPMDHSGSGRP